jgi:hypothetical protein
MSWYFSIYRALILSDNCTSITSSRFPLTCRGHAYKIKKLTGNGKQLLSGKITNILESVVVSMADRKGTLDAVAYLDFLAQGTSIRNDSLLRDYKHK